MKAIVINLHSRRDRWKKIQTYFEDTSISLRRLNALEHPIGSYGLFRSFIKALEYARDHRLPEVLILEDDCMPVDNWEEKWHKIQGWLKKNPEKWEIYSGGSGVIKNPVEIGRVDSTVFYNPELSTSAHWIYMEARTYNKAIKYFRSVCSNSKTAPELGIDIQMHSLKTIISYPFVAYQDSGYSNLQAKHRNLEEIFKRAEDSLKRRTRKKQKI
jgi:GR25 family glycosyltransferase involved in LPS biosynthesis